MIDWLLSPPVGPGFYPPVIHRLSSPEDPKRWGVDPSYSTTHSAEAVAKMNVIGRGKKYNLMAQVIPIYGFGILLYIFYIIYKVAIVTGLRGKQALWIQNTISPKMHEYEVFIIYTTFYLFFILFLFFTIITIVNIYYPKCFHSWHVRWRLLNQKTTRQVSNQT